MKLLKYILVCLISFSGFAQETQEVEEEFLPVVIGDKEAFISTKTGEYIYKSHEKTNPEELVTTDSGVVYTDISTHTVKKGETLSSIAKKHGLTIDTLKRDNKIKSSNLSIGQKLKIKKRSLVDSSSPVISYTGEERIVARLRPGQSPQGLNVPGGTPNQVGPKITTSINKKDLEVKEEEKTIEEVQSEIKALTNNLDEAEVEEEIREPADAIKEKEITEEGSIEIKEVIKDEIVETEKVVEEKVEETKEVSEKKEENLYIVKKGDTLYGIAKTHNITVTKLIEINKLISNNLSIGQKLKLQ